MRLSEEPKKGKSSTATNTSNTTNTNRAMKDHRKPAADIHRHDDYDDGNVEESTNYANDEVDESNRYNNEEDNVSWSNYEQLDEAGRAELLERAIKVLGAPSRNTNSNNNTNSSSSKKNIKSNNTKNKGR